VVTLEQIQARLKKLQAQADAIVVKQSSTVLETIRGLMEKHGLTTADIDAHVGSKKRGPKADSKTVVKAAQSVAKYRDPKSGATWSGHGRAPGWIANVKNRRTFLVDSKGTRVVPAPAKQAKVTGNYVGGPQPAKYRDPKSGATWSGRGRPPEWLASAKDRTRFLIEGAVESKAPTASKTSKLKPSGKRSAVAKQDTVKKAAASSNQIATKNVGKPLARKAIVKKVVAKRAPTVKTVAAEVDALTAPNGSADLST
jgi:DNA-binding protein H-NS